ncbi:hypothetical protein EC973_003737 [Apophysomyces ossiformis]|uniref:Uncharacterized protein n=1 Tax=Apophysomyces ossiformis TaxID=679940 RepID=A0A8H7EKY6_9FUNG|nr:hypothetical protein EC973_003737 [Apophysomyces ossiformis]
MVIGQAIASVGIPLSLNIMTKVATVWFTPNLRATAGMLVAANYGGIIAMFFVPCIATGEDKIEFALIIIAVLCTITLVPHIFLPARPAKAPLVEPSEARPSLLRGTAVLLKNGHFWILCAVHGINVGLSVAWGGLFNQAVTPYGYSNEESGNIVAVGMVAGALGCFVAGPILDATKRHILFLKLMAPLMCSTYVALIFIINRGSLAAILYVNALNQFFLSFMVPVVIELGVEVSYPIAESISTSILWQFSQLIGFILILVMDNFRDEKGIPHNNMFKALIFQACTAGVCMLLCFAYNGRMKRSDAEKSEILPQKPPMTHRELSYGQESTETLAITNEKNAEKV